MDTETAETREMDKLAADVISAARGFNAAVDAAQIAGLDCHTSLTGGAVINVVVHRRLAYLTRAPRYV